MQQTIKWDIQHGDSVTGRDCLLAVNSAYAAMGQVIQLQDPILADGASGTEISGSFIVETEDTFTAQYVERAFEALVRVALAGKIVRVKTKSLTGV